MAHPNEDLIRDAFAAFNRGDMEALQKQFWAEDIRWHQPGRSPLAGEYEGTEQVIQLFARFAELTGGTATAELEVPLASDENGTALCTIRGERAGTPWAVNWIQAYRFRDGKVAEIWMYAYDLYAADEIFS
jgi:ketosteroid isomerase-like protein